jgi:hypothetical protein
MYSVTTWYSTNLVLNGASFTVTQKAVLDTNEPQIAKKTCNHIVNFVTASGCSTSPEESIAISATSFPNQNYIVGNN